MTKRTFVVGAPGCDLEQLRLILSACLCKNAAWKGTKPSITPNPRLPVFDMRIVVNWHKGIDRPQKHDKTPTEIGHKIMLWEKTTKTPDHLPRDLFREALIAFEEKWKVWKAADQIYHSMVFGAPTDFEQSNEIMSLGHCRLIHVKPGAFQFRQLNPFSLPDGQAIDQYEFTKDAVEQFAGRRDSLDIHVVEPDTGVSSMIKGILRFIDIRNREKFIGKMEEPNDVAFQLIRNATEDLKRFATGRTQSAHALVDTDRQGAKIGDLPMGQTVETPATVAA